MLNVQTTQEYFGMTTEQLSEVRNEHGYTREDNKMLDEGLEVHWYDDLKTIEDETEEMQSYLKESGMELKAILKTVNNQYVVIFN